MRPDPVIRRLRSAIAATMIVFLASSGAFAHCDGLDGPVVKAARQALEDGDVNRVLIWVQKNDEAEVRRAFAQTQAVRALSPQAKELADRAFFETLVRLHRAGEGAPYTGLKPAGRDLGPAIPAADRALQEGSPEPLQALLTAAVQNGLREHYQEVLARKDFRSDDLAGGRAYVQAYVEFVHYVERLYQASTQPARGHFHEAQASQDEAKAGSRPQGARRVEAER